uniref:Uncharacterized protein n=1 Tax=Arundo donax TaxID=35708 RepID=A0A0A9TB32_ARUDO
MGQRGKNKIQNTSETTRDDVQFTSNSTVGRNPSTHRPRYQESYSSTPPLKPKSM